MHQHHQFEHGYFALAEYPVAPFAGRTFGGLYLLGRGGELTHGPYFTGRMSRGLVKLYQQFASPAHAWYDAGRDEFVFMPSSVRPPASGAFDENEAEAYGIRTGAHAFSDGFDRFRIGGDDWRWTLSTRMVRST